VYRNTTGNAALGRKRDVLTGIYEFTGTVPWTYYCCCFGCVPSRTSGWYRFARNGLSVFHRFGHNHLGKHFEYYKIKARAFIFSIR
jgi:hypothetical protein